MPDWIRIQRHGNAIEERGQFHHTFAFQEHILITSGNDEPDDDKNSVPRLPAPQFDKRALLSLIPIGVMFVRQLIKWRNQDHTIPTLPPHHPPALPNPHPQITVRNPEKDPVTGSY